MAAMKIALAGNPNCGKTTMFNALTGANQYVGNWPGVTVEKVEGRLKGASDVVVTDLPGIYSLSPYTPEEVVSRDYLAGSEPSAVLNIVDASNIERNLYLTTQIMELGKPVVLALNMMDVLKKRGDKIDSKKLAAALGCTVVETSALRGTGVAEAAAAAVSAARGGESAPVKAAFSADVEEAVSAMGALVPADVPAQLRRWYAIKLLERDPVVLKKLRLDAESARKAEGVAKALEEARGDDAESIITNERYEYITALLKGCAVKKSAGALSTTDKIDRIVTNRWLALPIFAAVMFIVYFVSITTVGTYMTDWTNDGLFGDGWHLFGIGSGAYDGAIAGYAAENLWTEDFVGTVQAAADAGVVGADELLGAVGDGDFGGFDEAYGLYGDALAEAGFDLSEAYDAAMEADGVPDTTEFGIWIPGIPVLIEAGLDALNCAEWLKGLVLDGIVGGVGAVLGFVPQMLVLFIFLAFLESCGYMARIAFIMDRIFRRFGLSGKSFIPILIGTGCGVPGVMASRTIESPADRRMTVMTTTFIPCGAKMPIIALIASALFGGAAWVAPSAYFLGVAAIIISGIMLKKTKPFAGEPSPFVMELPAYHWPTVGGILHSMWERGWSFIKRAGTVILVSSIIIWAGSVFGMTEGGFGFDPDMELESSILGYIGSAVKWIFAPLGFADIKATIATIMGLVAKEEVVGVFGVLDFEGMTRLAGYSFLVFNLLCAPCFAAIGAIRREMNDGRWTAFAIAYQCVFAYIIALIVFQFGRLFTVGFSAGTVFALLALALIVYMLVRPNKYAAEPRA